VSRDLGVIHDVPQATRGRRSLQEARGKRIRAVADLLSICDGKWIILPDARGKEIRARAVAVLLTCHGNEIRRIPQEARGEVVAIFQAIQRATRGIQPKTRGDVVTVPQATRGRSSLQEARGKRIRAVADLLLMPDGKWTIFPDARGEQIVESNGRSNAGSVSGSRNINSNSSNDATSSVENSVAFNGERFNGSNRVQRERKDRQIRRRRSDGKRPW
jgi:hypothetical protein